MSADMEDVLTEVLCRAFPLASGEQLLRGAEQFRKIIDNERRRSAVAARIRITDFLRSHGHYAAVDLLKELPNE